MIRSLAGRMTLASGWYRVVAAVAAGAIGSLAMPPFGVWPALVPSLAVAIWLLDGSAGTTPLRTLARAAGAGWCWGFGYFVAGLWWLGAAFLVEADVFAWLLPFGVLGLPALLAFFPAAGFAAARLLWSDGVGRIFAFAAALAAAEWLRGHVFTGFPWNSLGLAFGQNLWLMQTASLVGLAGLTVAAALVGAAPATLGTGTTRAGRIYPSVAAFVGLGAMAAFGAARLSGADGGDVPGVRLRIMQPNLPQDAKFNPANGEAILRRYLELSDRATSPRTSGIADVTHLVWPESAFPFLLGREPAALARIAAVLPRNGVLLTGAARSTDPMPGEVARRFYNSIQAVDATGAIVATYDKVHLVPFGEYVPSFLDRGLRALGIREFVAIPGGFTAGERRSAFMAPGLPPAAATVCYEAIFADETLPPGPRPGLILNVTNDGWFGNTPGPHQHFAQARLRAVERGLPLVRAANTGISAVVDPYGRIRTALPLGREGVIDSSLPRVANDTIFNQHGGWVAASLMVGCLLVAAVTRRRRADRSQRPSW